MNIIKKILNLLLASVLLFVLFIPIFFILFILFEFVGRIGFVVSIIVLIIYTLMEILIIVDAIFPNNSLSKKIINFCYSTKEEYIHKISTPINEINSELNLKSIIKTIIIQYNILYKYIIIFFITYFLVSPDEPIMLFTVMVISFVFMTANATVKKRNKFECMKCGKIVYGKHGSYINKKGCYGNGQHKFEEVEHNIADNYRCTKCGEIRYSRTGKYLNTFGCPKGGVHNFIKE